jgi:hypothetical protein
LPITLDDYAPIVGEEVVGQLHRLAGHLQGRRFVHIMQKLRYQGHTWRRQVAGRIKAG